MTVMSEKRLLHHGRVTDVYRFVSAPKHRTQGVITVEGVQDRHTLLEKRLAMYRTDVVEMLGELPAGFHRPEHQGWGFGMLVMDRHGVVWATDMEVLERLCVLGIGLGVAEWCNQRSDWHRTGGFPYFVCDLRRAVQ